nr:protein FAM114A2-like [Lytechinus pictus]XP_054754789.1 protein FAM114A2-like [Lytechinus pictus]
MADCSDSDAEVTFESADEGEQDEIVEEKKDDNDASKPVPSQSQDNDSVASATQKESEHSSRTEVPVDESRTKGEESMEEPYVSKQENGKDGEGMEHDVNKTESRTDLSDETGGGDAKETVKTDDGNETEGTPGKEKEQKEPEGEEIVNRGASSGQEDTETDAKAGKGPENASSASGGGWGWGGWGTSLLSSAAATVTKVSDNVGKGLTQVMENVETSLGVPKPEELGEIEKEEAKKMAKEKEEQSAKPDEGDQEIKEGECSEDKREGKEEDVNEGAGIGSFFSSGASVFTSAMGKTVSGGLDALEMIGRKTMDILQEGDPRLEKKRGMIIPKREKSNLSEVLRQAKKDAEEEAARRQEEEEHQKYNFSFLFDQYQGLAHLEALEMLSNQSETKVQSSISIVTDDRLDDLKTELLEVRDAFQLEDLDAVDEETASDQDFVNVITELLFSLSMAATPDKLQRVQKETRDWLTAHASQQNEDGDKENKNMIDIKDIHAKAMQTLAELTARTIEQFHKVSELMLLGQETEQAKAKSPVERATTLSKLASILSAEVSSVATKFCELLSSLGDQGSEEVNTIITNIYLEASNSTSYIQDAFQLLLPILQDIVVMTKNSEDEMT